MCHIMALLFRNQFTHRFPIFLPPLSKNTAPVEQNVSPPISASCLTRKSLIPKIVISQTGRTTRTPSASSNQREKNADETSRTLQRVEHSKFATKFPFPTLNLPPPGLLLTP